MSVACTTRRFQFSAAHRYWVPAWSAAENERVFGRLTVAHGHNYTLDVTLRGPVDERTGMVVDLAAVKRIVTETVVDRFDHADLNADVLFHRRVPTTENIAIAALQTTSVRRRPRRSPSAPVSGAENADEYVRSPRNSPAENVLPPIRRMWNGAVGNSWNADRNTVKLNPHMRKNRGVNSGSGAPAIRTA